MVPVLVHANRSAKRMMRKERPDFPKKEGHHEVGFKERFKVKLGV